MAASRRERTSRKSDEETLRQKALGVDEEHAKDSQASAPAMPRLDGGALEPETWLSLQQAIGNRSVGGLLARQRDGQALPAETRHNMETAFGRDFGQVQVYSGPEVDEAAQSLQAAAFTVGDGIYLPAAFPGFDDPFGKQVLGEELAHVAQGAGQNGVERVTVPDETAERQAHAAGQAAAAGQKTELGAAPEAAGAVARFDLGDLKRLYNSVTGGTETAQRVERTELSDEDKDRLASGALDPLATMLGVLAGKVGAAGGKVNPKTLQPIADNTEGLSKFIMAFNGPPTVQPVLESAAMSTANGRNAILAAIDPASTIKNVADGMSSTAAEIDGLATPTPAAPAKAGSQPGAEAPDVLSTAEAQQLQTGAVEPLRSIAEQLKVEGTDLDIIVARLHGIPGLLRSFSKPAAIVPQLRRKAMSVEVQARGLQFVLDGAQGAIADAISEWSTAVGLLGGLTAKSASGGAAGTTTGAAAAADDDDKNKSD